LIRPKSIKLLEYNYKEVEKEILKLFKEARVLKKE